MSERGEQRVAKITSTMLGWEDHGIMTCYLYLDYGGSGQGAGGVVLDDIGEPHRVGTAEGMEFIIRLLRACGVEKWEDLPGRTVYAWHDHSKVYGIEPLPTEPGEPFFFADLWKEESK